MAADLIEHHFSKRPKQIIPLYGGLSNFVFEVKTSEGLLVLRLSEQAGQMNLFLKEQWAVAKAKEKGVPVPDILEVGQDSASLPYMISRKIDGTSPLQHKERKSIIEEMGRYLVLIHKVPTSGYGETYDWSQNTLSKKNTWQSYLHEEYNAGERIKILKQHQMLNTKQANRLTAIVRQMETWNKKPCLQHGDMRLKNLLVDRSGKISAIIDWDQSVSSIPPYWDLSIALHDLSIDEKMCFLEGYGMRDKMLAEAAPFLKAINFLNYTETIKQMTKTGDKKKLAQLRTRLSGALDLFSL